MTQSWYADDASTEGRLEGLRRWWDKLETLGPKFGYFPNAGKTWLVVKLEHLKTAEFQFQ